MLYTIWTGLVFLFLVGLEVSAIADQQQRKNNWTTEELLQGPAKADDRRIVEFVKDTKNGFLIPPSNKPYNLKNSNPEFTEQALIVQQILNHQKNGFFVECGAHDGVQGSNTLALEKNYGWKVRVFDEGLLIEANSEIVKRLMRVHRKAWVSPTCLSPKSYPVKLPFGNLAVNRGGSRILLELEDSAKSLPKLFRGSERFAGRKRRRGNKTTVFFRPEIIQCFPLATFLYALGVDTVDYFSLDVEGNELDVMESIPFDKIYFKILTVEYRRKRGNNTKARDFIANFLKQHGFYVFGIIPDKKWPVDDLVFVHESVTVPNFSSPYRIDNAKTKIR